jgi:hypothetical protein
MKREGIKIGGDKMAKFLILWENDMTKMPTDLKELVTLRSKMMNMVKDDLKSGRMKDWGKFAGENTGYAIAEGTEKEIDLGLARYVPYVKFKVQAIISASQMEEVFKALLQA